MFQLDKLCHFAACLLITLIWGALTWAITPTVGAVLISAAGAGLGAGFGKEYGDLVAKDNTWDWKDIIADVVGVAIAVLILLIIMIL